MFTCAARNYSCYQEKYANFITSMALVDNAIENTKESNAMFLSQQHHLKYYPMTK